MDTKDEMLPPVTIIIEWENAIDVEDEWTSRAMSSLEAELERNHNRMAAKPKVMYLFNENAVKAETIQGVIDQVVPRLGELADVEIVPTPGYTYYQLKNFGVSRSTTPLVIILDSDAGPQPGWLAALLKPFTDKDIMAVGGFTVLGHEDLLSRTMALSWIFNLPSEREETEKRHKIHPNNCAFRTEFFRQNPYPTLKGAFKKQCGFWLRDIDKRGFKWVRTADAITIHAPHPSVNYIAWRAWKTGLDRDFQAYHTVTRSRIRRFGYAFYFWVNKLARSWTRIWTKGGEVNLPIWQRPFAMLISLAFFTTMLTAEIWSSLTRSFDPLPETGSTPPAIAS